jgi:hypothetical protein
MSVLVEKRVNQMKFTRIYQFFFAAGQIFRKLCRLQTHFGGKTHKSNEIYGNLRVFYAAGQIFRKFFPAA